MNTIFEPQTCCKTTNLKSQSEVISKLNITYSKILYPTARVAYLGSETQNGEIKYSGRVIFSLYYLEDGKVKCTESGVEFVTKKQDEEIGEKSKTEIELKIDSVDYKIENQVILTAIVTADITVKNAYEKKCLSGGDLILKKQDVTTLKLIGIASQNFEIEDEFEVNDSAFSPLTPTASAYITHCTAGANAVICDGEVCFNIPLASDNDIKTVERKSPFRFELEIADVMPINKCFAEVYVTSNSANIEIDEDKNKSRITLLASINIKAKAFKEIDNTFACDAFSLEKNIDKELEKIESLDYQKSYLFTKNVSGQAFIDSEVGENASILSTCMGSVKIAKTEETQDGIIVEGVVTTSSIIKNDNGVNAVKLELPFSQELQLEKGDEYKVKAVVTDINVRLLPSNEIEMNAELKILVHTYKNKCVYAIVGITEKEDLKKEDSAISVCFARKGDTLWNIAKELKVPLEVIEKLNPDLEFPLSMNERVLVYRNL